MLSVEGTKLYGKLEAETDHATGFKQSGSLTTAQTSERWEIIKRNAARARSCELQLKRWFPAHSPTATAPLPVDACCDWSLFSLVDGLEAELLTPAECGATMNHGGVDLIRTDDLVGGMWLPGDGSGSPIDLTMSFAAGARMHGVEVHEGVGVERFRTAALPGLGCNKVNFAYACRLQAAARRYMSPMHGGCRLQQGDTSHACRLQAAAR